MTIETLINYQTSFSPSFDIEEFIVKLSTLLNLQKALFEFTFIDDETMSKMHLDHFNDASRTDIITFNLETIEEPHGDIYISIAEARRNAKSLNNTLEHELKTLLIHGVLHCLGYNDQTKDEQALMFKKQDALIAQLQEGL